jgi:undecaprenyl-diphosphatase
MEEIETQSTSRRAFYKQRHIKGLDQFFNRWNQREIGFVRIAVQRSHSPYLRKASLFINRLSDGWLYAIITFLLLTFQGRSSWRLLFTSGLAAAVSHCFYPFIKKRLARLRPCDYDRSLNLAVKVWDRYSCPSGHVMTSIVVAVPLAVGFPSLLPAIVVACLSIAWARISLGHHYLSDLLLGALLGFMTALPLSFLLL